MGRMGWVVLVPAKASTDAKSRLNDQRRDDLAAAMTADVLAAARVTAGVDDVVTVPFGGHGLDGDLTLAASAYPVRPVAVLMGDLPAIRPAELAAALVAAHAHERALVADAEGTGTVLLTARTGPLLRPAYGPGSRARHAAQGAVDLTDTLAGVTEGLRRDVDTTDDLEAATALGVGPATSAVLGCHRPLAGAT
jgi:2-phospho-L-lactate guanylyltransferase